MKLQRFAIAANKRAWRIALIVLLAAGVAPLLGNAVWVGGGWIGAGREYLADLPGLVVLTLVQAVPFLLLGASVARTERKVGLISVTIASLIVVAASAFGYWVVFFPGEDSSSTDALIFVTIIPLQLVVAAIGSAIAQGRRQRVTRVEA